MKKMIKREKKKQNRVINEEHLKLSEIVKEVHKNLRENAKVFGPDKAWISHCNRRETLRKYAEAMEKLSTKYWEENYIKNFGKAKSRIQWIYQYCFSYFFENELLRQRKREKEIKGKLETNETTLQITLIDDEFKKESKLKVLDVGSCYNPLKEYSCFDVLPIDIAPANDDVKLCDFLNIKILNKAEAEANCGNDKIKELKSCTFHVIVFSLFLEYFPSSEQRLQCCLNAYELLKYEGVLIIITPDSKHVGSNAKIMKTWRFILAKIGFSRIKYEKLPHIHCMAFRKSINSKMAKRWADLQKSEQFYKDICIPQDFN